MSTLRLWFLVFLHYAFSLLIILPYCNMLYFFKVIFHLLLFLVIIIGPPSNRMGHFST